MKLIGEPIFSLDSDGKLISRLGTIFFRTPGLVTTGSIHSLQRAMWLEDVARDLGRPLTQDEENAELSESVDLIFTENHILIRPDPERMDLAFRADTELQKLVSKRRIRFLNTSSIKVRAALRERGENWRMSRHPLSREDFYDLIERSRLSINEQPIYYYNRASGTRYVTPSCYDYVKTLEPEAYRRQCREFILGLGRRNHHGHPEIDLFPTFISPEVKHAFRQIKVDELSDDELRAAIEKVVTVHRMLMPVELRDETVENPDWRNEMCATLVRTPNETAVGDQELVAGIAPEFFRQIEWLPGARIVNGEVVFDEVFEEAARTQEPGLVALCDPRVKALFFNTMRLFGKVAYINIGRIAHSIARQPVEGNRRGNVYIMQYREVGTLQTHVLMIRLQKWGVAERLDEGKDLLQAICETAEYADYVLDRRLMCRQLGMNLPPRIGYGTFSEVYHGANEQYEGSTIRTMYFVREYVPGIASDKVPLARLRNPAWANKFAFLMGGAAAVDAVVGRRSSVTKELLFDRNYEVVQIGKDGMPEEVKITDHAGTFVNYEHPLISYIAQYANFARKREKYVTDYPNFVEAYAEGFRRKLTQMKNAYNVRRKVFDNLFQDRPYDTNGSGAYRWACVLNRLDQCNVDEVVAALKMAIAC